MPGVMTKFFTTTFGNVTDLNVSHCRLTSGDAEVSSYAESYHTTHPLTHTHTHNTHKQVFGKVLAKNTALKNLDMSFNIIGKHGARFLASGLSTNTRLEVSCFVSNDNGLIISHVVCLSQ